MILNRAYDRMENAEAQMTDSEVCGYRRWPAHLTVEQMRRQIAWEQSPEFRRRIPC